MNPFVYPKERHRRQQRPAQLSDYRDYKPVLRIEFSRRCVYCRMPDAMGGGTDNYGVDHYKPKSTFPHLLVEYRNLFYSCNKCNRRKGAYWPNTAKLHVRFVPNVCDHVMANHLNFARAYVNGSTPAGRFTIDLLELNAPERRAVRTLILDALGLFMKKRSECRQVRAAIQRKAASPAKAEAALARIEARLAEIDAHIAMLSGA